MRKCSRLLPRREELVKFKPLNSQSLKLRNHVGSSGGGPSQAFCLQEMFNMFTCLKKHEFAQSPCSSEITTFQSCAAKHKAEMAQRKIDERAGVLTPGATNLSPIQLNTLLKKFPH